MKLRIVTATRGESRFWSTTVESLVAAAPKSEHVIVCPKPRISRMAAARSKPRVLGENHVGLYANLVAGLEADPMDWDVFSWLNDDDLLLAPGFPQALNLLESNADADVVFGRVKLIDSHGKGIGQLPVTRKAADLISLWAHGIIPFAQPGTIIRRRVWDKLGGFDLAYRNAGDLDFFIRAATFGAKFIFLDQEIAAFRLSAGQLSKRRAEVEAETVRALRSLRTTRPSLAALWRFRAGNIAVYLKRLWLHGWVSMRELYDRTE